MFSPPKCMRAPGGGTGALNHAIVIVKNGLVNPLYVCVAENTLEVASNTACLIILRLTTEHLQLNKKNILYYPHALLLLYNTLNECTISCSALSNIRGLMQEPHYHQLSHKLDSTCRILCFSLFLIDLISCLQTFVLHCSFLGIIQILKAIRI